MRSSLILVGLLVALTGKFLALPTSIRLDTADRNHDGRADRWQYYDSQNVLLRQSIDTNFDGRSDVQESFANRHLVRRESDRNFDDRVDLIEEFDPASGEHTRSLVDVDFDGRADLLVLFAHGQPVFSEWAPAESGWQNVSALTPPPTPRSGDDSLQTVADPFAGTERWQSSAPPIAHDTSSAETRSITVAPQPFDVGRNIIQRLAEPRTALLSRGIQSSHPRGPPITHLS
jgi:hypothetical protein